MLTNLKQSTAGFSLLEVVVVMVIIGILATIAYPMYQNHVRQTRRADAKSALVELAQLQEKYYFRNPSNGGNHTYATDFKTLLEKGLSGFKIVDNTTLESRERYYTIVFDNSDDVDPNRAFRFTATPTEKGGQNNDSCEEFSIDNIGNKNSEPARECW
jgi:type IV pilus assembly protein PilE